MGSSLVFGTAELQFAIPSREIDKCRERRPGYCGGFYIHITIINGCMRIFRSWAPAVCLFALSLVALICVDRASAQSEGNQIAFLRFRMSNDALTLLDMNVRPGKLKKLRGYSEINGEIEFDLVGKTGEITYSSSIEDPLVQRVEGVGDTGELVVVELELDEAEFTIRIPYSDHLESIAFRRRSHDRSSKTIDYEPLGLFELPHPSSE
jgi:hypothetical protein